MTLRAIVGLSILFSVTAVPEGWGAEKLSVQALGARLASRPSGADAEALASDIRSWFGKDRAGKPNVINGASPKVEGLDTAWAIEVANAKTAAVVTSDGKTVPMLHIDGTPLFAATLPLAAGSAFRWTYVADGDKEGKKGQLEVYLDAPELAEIPGVPRGRLTQQKAWESQIYPKTKRDWWVYVPAQYTDSQPACVMVFQDGGGYRGFVPTVFDNLISKKEMPVTVAIFINPGTGPGEGGRGQRSVEYDTLSDRYSRFLLEEILPEVEKTVKLRHDPDSRAIAGISSGGICAWTVAWEHPDEFRKVLSWVGSFTNIASGKSGREGGHNYEAMIRKTPKKPIRVFLQDGANDLDNANGNWPLANQQMARALEFSKYDYKFVFGQGFHSNRQGRSILPDSLRWLWRDYKPEDSHAWLEDVAGEETLTWVRERNAESTSELAKSERFQTLERRILEMLDSNDRIPVIQKIGAYYYNFWRDAKNPRGLWRRTTLEEYKKAQPNWELVLDLDALGKAEKENWVWQGAQVLRPEHKLALISLSRGGADASVEREFDLPTKAFVDDGYRLPEAKSRVAWRGPDSVFVATDFGPGSLTRSGYPRIVKEWKRGTALADATVVFEGQPGDVGASAARDLTPGFERDFVVRGIASRTTEFFLRRDGRLIKIEKPDDAQASFHREWLLLRLRSNWKVDGTNYPAGALIATDLEAYLKGTRKFDLLFEPTERKSLARFSFTRHHVLLNELDNVRSRVSVLTHKDGRWVRESLPGVSEFGEVVAHAVDPEDSDAYFLDTTDFLTPSALAIGTVGGGPAQTLKQLPAFFDAKGLAVTQHEATSKDGTRIPYFEVARQNLTRDGKTPTLLNGYGGFEIPMLPSYRPTFGVAWLEQGGVYVLANIRGGGEFGPKWHQSALKENRHRAYEDFIAVAEDLIRRQVTSPAHLGVMGRSNGGLLVGNMLTRRPELFGAIVCGSPLLDMKRYSHLLAGASWMAEYGNPDVPADWSYIRTFSPYHNVEKTVRYPRTLFTTSTRDDRVHPGHARKMVAKMREQGHDVLLYENIEGGHGAAADNKQSAFMDALAFSFLWQELKK
jgi:prolyl oligopeptidase